MASVELQDLCKTYRGAKSEAVQALRRLHLSVADHERLVLVGPSGCGKTTTLRLIAGLEQASSGTIRLDNRRVNEVPPKERDVAMVFQSGAIFPHLTVFDNLGFGLKVRRVPKAEMQERVRSVADLLELTAVLSRKPAALSGGERQRVALGRAMIRRPGVFLLDEPLSHLDPAMRAQMRAELNRLHRRLAATTIYVTHDQLEAMAMGDRIAVLHDGVLQQAALPTTLYHQPANMFVAGFFGSPPMNLFHGALTDRKGQLWFLEGGTALSEEARRFQVRIPSEMAERVRGETGSRRVLGIRPEHVILRPLERRAEMENVIPATVEFVEALGSEWHVQLSTERHRFMAKSVQAGAWAVQEPVQAVLEMKQARFFDPDSGMAL